MFVYFPIEKSIWFTTEQERMDFLCFRTLNSWSWRNRDRPSAITCHWDWSRSPIRAFWGYQNVTLSALCALDGTDKVLPAVRTNCEYLGENWIMVLPCRPCPSLFPQRLKTEHLVKGVGVASYLSLYIYWLASICLIQHLTWQR